MRSRSPHVVRLLALLAALAVLAAACGSSDDDTAATDSASTTESATTSSESGTVTVPADDNEEAAEPAETDDDAASEPAPTTVPEAPPVFEGERVVAIGSNVWPIVGDLLALGVTPVAIYSQLGNQEMPDYIAGPYGDQLADTEITYLNIVEISPEEILLLQPDRVVMPEFFRGLVQTNPVWSEVLAEEDNAVFTPVLNWQASLGTIAAAAGESADATVAELQAIYDARIAELAASLPYDPADVLFNTFQWNEDGTYLPTRQDAPIVQVAEQLGFQIHPSLVPENGPPLSQETVTEMDADLVFIQVRNVEFESLATDPLWSLTQAGQTGNTFERFQFGQQAGWLETLELLDLLAEELPRYQPS